MKRLLPLALALCTTAAATAQTITNPSPFNLSTGNYLMNNWPAASPAGTYPSNMGFYYLDTTSDPNASASIYSDYTGVYDGTSATRMLGLDLGGFAFLNTGTTSVNKLGAAVLALNTQNRNTVTVSWTGKTVVSNPRTYEIAMFYRIGTSGAWMPVINPATTDTARYIATATGDSATLGPITLPATVNNLPEVDICWKYFLSDTSTQGGARAELGINNINVSSLGASFPVLAVTPVTLSTFAAAVNGTSPAQSIAVSGTSLTGTVTVTAPAGFEVSTTAGSGYSSSVVLTQSGGTLASTPVYVRFHPTAAGSVSDNVVVSTTGGASQNVSVSGFTCTSTNPAAFATAGGTYSFNTWDSLAAPGTYPANMVFQVANNAAPALVNTPMIADWTCAYDLPSRPRFIGLESDGVAFLNTGSAQYDNCDSVAATTAQNIFVGAAVLGLNTINSSNIILSYTAGTVTQGDGATPRVYHITLQARPDSSSNFTDVAGNDYTSANQTAGTSQPFTYTLPATMAGLPYMQFRWLYNAETLAGSSGTRPELRLDDVTVTATPTTGISNVVLTNSNAAYPNPIAANGTVHFVQAVSGNVYDVFGRRIATLTNSKSWEVKDVAAGIYTVVANNGTQLRIQVL